MQDTIREFGSQIRRIFHVNRGVPSGVGSQPVATAERFGRGTRWTPLDADGELFCARAAGNANSRQPRKHSEQKLVSRDSRPSSNTRSWNQNSGRVAVLSSLVGSSSNTRVKYRPSKEVRGNYRAAPYNINPNRRLNLGVIGGERDPANNMFECQVCCKDHPNVSFISGSQAIAYSRAVFLDQGATADAIFAADTAREILLISRGFPTLPDDYVQNEEGLQWEIFSWKFQNVPAFQRRLRESGDVSFTGSGGPTTRKQVNAYGKLLTAFRDQMLGEGARGLCYRSDMSTRTADTGPRQTNAHHLNRGRLTTTSQPRQPEQRIDETPEPDPPASKADTDDAPSTVTEGASHIDRDRATTTSPPRQPEQRVHQTPKVATTPDVNPDDPAPVTPESVPRDKQDRLTATSRSLPSVQRINSTPETEPPVSDLHVAPFPR